MQMGPSSPKQRHGKWVEGREKNGETGDIKIRKEQYDQNDQEEGRRKRGCQGKIKISKDETEIKLREWKQQRR